MDIMNAPVLEWYNIPPGSDPNPQVEIFDPTSFAQGCPAWTLTDSDPSMAHYPHGLEPSLNQPFQYPFEFTMPECSMFDLDLSAMAYQPEPSGIASWEDLPPSPIESVDSDSSGASIPTIETSPSFDYTSEEFWPIPANATAGGVPLDLKDLQSRPNSTEHEPVAAASSPSAKAVEPLTYDALFGNQDTSSTWSPNPMPSSSSLSIAPVPQSSFSSAQSILYATLPLPSSSSAPNSTCPKTSLSFGRHKVANGAISKRRAARRSKLNSVMSTCGVVTFVPSNDPSLSLTIPTAPSYTSVKPLKKTPTPRPGSEIIGICQWQSNYITRPDGCISQSCGIFLGELTNGQFLQHLTEVHHEPEYTGSDLMKCKWNQCQGIKADKYGFYKAGNMRRHVLCKGHTKVLERPESNGESGLYE